MRECLTKPLIADYSGCMVKNPVCDFAVSFGFSYLCNNPRHKEFYAIRNSSGYKLDHNALYRDLRESQRRTFISTVKESIDNLAFEAL